MPQLNIFFVGMPMKVLVGLLVIGVLLPATAIFAGQLVSGQALMFTDLLRAMQRG
jgi:flagellar biosynthesis protein FliR